MCEIYSPAAQLLAADLTRGERNPPIFYTGRPARSLLTFKYITISNGVIFLSERSNLNFFGDGQTKRHKISQICKYISQIFVNVLILVRYVNVAIFVFSHYSFSLLSVICV
jgi:hypothetical protein